MKLNNDEYINYSSCETLLIHFTCRIKPKWQILIYIYHILFSNNKKRKIHLFLSFEFTYNSIHPVNLKSNIIKFKEDFNKILA